MNKEIIEIEAKKNIDATGLARFISGISGVTRSYVAGGQSVRIEYNRDWTQPKRLLKRIATFGRQDHRGRKATIVSLREIAA